MGEWVWTATGRHAVQEGARKGEWVQFWAENMQHLVGEKWELNFCTVCCVCVCCVFSPGGLCVFAL